MTMTKTLLATAIVLAFAGTASAKIIQAPLTGDHTFDEDVRVEGSNRIPNGLLNGNLTGSGTVEMIATDKSSVLGSDNSNVTGKDVFLESKKGTAVSSYGNHTVTATNNVTILGVEDAIQGQGEGDPTTINITAGNELSVTSEKEQAVQAMRGDITLKAKKISLSSKQDQAVKQHGNSTTRIEADVIDIQGFTEKPKWDSKLAALEVKEGKLELIGNQSINISANGANYKSAVITAKDTTLVIKSPEATLQGNLVAKGTTQLDGGLVFNGKKAQIDNLTGDQATFTVTRADQTVEIKNQNKALTVNGTGDVNDQVGITGIVAGSTGKGIVNLTGQEAGVRVTVDEGMSASAATGVLDSNGNLTNVQTTSNSIMSNTLDLVSSTPLALNRIMMTDLRKRMGDLRATNGVNGVWARYDGGKFAGDRGLDDKFSTVEIGADTASLVDGLRLGVAFSYTDSKADMLRGNADTDAFSLAAYGTKFFDNGLYADVIGRIATADTDVTIDGNKTGSMDNLAVSLSGEMGWHFDLSELLYVEPQTELTYTNVDSDTLTLSSGHRYDFDSVNSLIGRVGVATGFKCPSNFGDVYVRVSAVHEFLGDAKVTSGNAIHDVDGQDTWIEYGLGANFNLNQNAYLYTEVERSEGADFEQDWRANIGVRFAF